MRFDSAESILAQNVHTLRNIMAVCCQWNQVGLRSLHKLVYFVGEDLERGALSLCRGGLFRSTFGTSRRQYCSPREVVKVPSSIVSDCERCGAAMRMPPNGFYDISGSTETFPVFRIILKQPPRLQAIGLRMQGNVLLHFGSFTIRLSRPVSLPVKSLACLACLVSFPS